MKADVPSLAAIDRAADRLGCSRAVVQAFAAVEAGPEGAFYDTGEPVILFERHHFFRRTGGEFKGARVPGVSADWARICEPTPGGYGPSSKQHLRLQAAAALDRDAALRSASWGLYQIMGSNHAACGHASLQAFVNAMYRSADDHLDAFVAFIQFDARLTRALCAQDWATAARLYNGPTYAKSGYHLRLAAAFDRFSQEQHT